MIASLAKRGSWNRNRMCLNHGNLGREYDGTKGRTSCTSLMTVTCGFMVTKGCYGDIGVLEIFVRLGRV